MQGGKGRLVGLAIAAVATALVHGRMETASAASSGRLYLPEPERARALALGFEPVLADYYWIQALQIVGGAESPATTHGGEVADLMELVTFLDPWVGHPYRFAGIWLTGSPEDVRRGNALLERGISYHPLDWRNRFYLGYNHFFYLGENDRAADVLEDAVGLERAPSYLGALVTRLRAASGGLETAELFLRELIRDAPEGYARAEYLKALDEIVTERRARQLDRARALFRERHGRDIREPSELWEGPLRVIRAAPPAHPQFPGFAWEIDEESGEIVSTFYEDRYRLHLRYRDAELAERWQRTEEARDPEAGAPGEVRP